MIQKYKNIIIILISIYFLGELVYHKNLIFNTIYFSLDIWVKNLIPSLFPIFVISDIIISYNLIYYIPRKIKLFISKIFNISEQSVIIFLLSLISGFPSNAINTKKLLDLKLINEKEASHILMFTNFSNPLFILGTIASFFYYQENIGIILLLSHYISNIIIGILFRKRNTPSANNNIIITNNGNFGIIFTNAIKKAIDNLLLISGTITCFLIISTIIVNSLHISSNYAFIIQGIIEITMGLKLLSNSTINEVIRIILTSMFLSFGGLSVHMQVFSQIVDTNISIKPFIFGRIIQALLAGLITFILYIMLT